ncbi:hypothetical protein M413DRAFT_445425 [Hebeloma cylindrosporum]|uniref:RING-type domain-containing protein n=1 Tax=Hebeloma cylindrosporum TaxID=76867 RepID=A0A0C3CB25_HEBCY|nr:hypothetical protein M413DRAFT_445425 [Hebeloma cylindrosporum h7]
MPASTRQATPGPSTILQPHTTQSVNSKKRAATEPGVEERDTKKLRVDGTPTTMGNVNETKDKKKKKRKKRKRTSVVLPDPPMQHRERLRSGSRSVAPPSAATTTASVRQRTTPPVAAAAPAGTPNREEEEDEEPVLSSSDKGKGKAKSDSPPPSHPPQPVSSSIAGPSSPIMPDSTEVARLKAQLAEKTTLLERHQTHLNHHQQSLTCQICLDLMHKPYALVPCGHITCYGCLVRWFTAPQNPQQQNANAAEQHQDSIEHILNSPAVRNGAFMRRRKNCPVCRAVVQERPIEMWGIKSMVAALVRSGLADLPAPAAEPDPPPAAAANNGRDDNNDPWRNVFRRVAARNNFGAYMYDHLLPMPHPHNYGPPQGPNGAVANGGEAERAQLGWFDMEDGGIYRCIDCYHEIWEGICTSCDRRYPGHHLDDDDDDDIRFDDSDDDGEDDDGGYDGHFRGGIGRFMEAIMNDEDDLDDDEDEDRSVDGMLADVAALEEEIEHREALIRQLRIEAGDDHDDEHWPNHEGDVAAMLNELVGDDDDDEEEEEEYPGDVWYRRPVRRHRRGGARIEEFEHNDEEEDSQYGGSFIDDQAMEEHGHEDGVSDEDEVEFIDPPRQQNNARRRRPLVVVDSTDDEDESEVENPGALARRLGRGTRLGQPQPFAAAPRGRHINVSDDDEDEIYITGHGDEEEAENDSDIEYLSEEEPAFAITRSGRPPRRVVYESESDS